MQLFESIKLAFAAISSSKLRSILTLLGIAIGLFSIIVVMTAISAIQKTVEDTFNSIGANNYIIQKMPAVRLGHGSWRQYRNREDLTIETGRKLKEMTSLPEAISLEFYRNGQTVKSRYDATNPNITIVAADMDIFRVNDYTVAEGRGFTQADMDITRNIAIIGHDVAEKLFPNTYPVGQDVTLENMTLEVIGVFEEVGSVLGQSQDNFILIPINLYEKKYGDHRSGNYTVMAPSAELADETLDEVIGALRVIRKVEPGEENDFEIITNDQLIGQFNDLTFYFRLGAGVIATIALIAAGVGIMNIMLVSVTERTKEIGIRKAIGAKKSVIRTQFVIEAVVLSLIGGIAGIILGIIIGNVVALQIGVSGVFPFEWVLIGLLVTTTVGLVFGVYPAVKASNLDPIEALRYE